MTEQKPWWQSKTILLGIAGVLAGIAGFGDLLTEEVVDALLVVVGAGTALFRKFATAKVSPVTTP